MVSQPGSWQAIVYQDEDGAWCAEVPALPGCFSAGDTRNEAIRNIKEAAQLWLEAQRDLGRRVPESDTTVEVIRISA